MTAATTALLCQQCTTGTLQSFHHGLSWEWRPRKRMASGLSPSPSPSWRTWRAELPRSHRGPLFTSSTTTTTTSTRASSATTGTTAEEKEEPTIDELLTNLEKSEAGASDTAAGTQRRRPPAGTPSRITRTFPVQDEDLVADKVLTGRIKSIMTFGAFVDLGARVDGLLHISKLGEGFVKAVEDVVQVGQEVQVQILEADLQNRRVKLKLYDPTPKPEPTRAPSSGAPATGGREAFRGKIAGRGAPGAAGQNRRAATDKPKTSNYQKGQAATGVVKNLTRRGCFVELPGGEEGFMHANEISVAGENVPIETLVKVGQEVKVKVLRIIEGRINLTMKEELDLKKVNEEFNGSMTATNAFELAFRKNAAIRKYLEESGRLPVVEAADKKSKKTKAEEAHVNAEAPEDPASTADEAEIVKEEAPASQEKEPSVEQEATETVSAVREELPKEEEEELSEPKDVVAADAVPDVEDKRVEKEPQEAVENVEKPGDEEVPVAEVENELVENKEEPAEVTSAAVQDKEPQQKEDVKEEEDEVSETKTEKALEDDKSADDEKAKEAIAEVKENVEETKEESTTKEEMLATEAESVGTVISAALVKSLRQQSGAGMMDCKKALVETNGDFELAIEYLRKKGLAGADKKASRIAAEGAIGSYIHDGRIGVLLEVNCETDFVSRGELFTQLVEDLGMQLAASQQVEYVSVDDIPAEVKSKEFEIEMQREDIQSKPEAVRAKIVEGRVAKRLAELALLEKTFIKNDSLLVKDLVRQTIAAVGENIQVRRFARYIVGEGLEKRSYDIAAEVAAQAEAQAQKVVEAPATESTSDSSGSSETDKDAQTIAISASLVKQLREETGTGMMDCKKALVACKGDFEQAKDYLRKKGLASAEKKAGRIAAEGMVVSYIHASRIGVLVEVNSETDFVARNTVFKELADDLAMQLVACPQVEYVSVDDISADIKDKEREIEMQRDDLQNKPEQIRAKIVEGRLSKLLAERALLEQPYLKDDTRLVKDVLQAKTVSLGENIRVRRFERFTLGEGIEKKAHNLAEEIAALKPV
ncbi:titin [Selaginella moellendorffii]|uniref:titin n=1 Tax=Selaginella moellendorffii TaxID=88036 RepID=UPI000D1C2143|nr:titin [Selaginella moellendorffii]|eukprot:XP_024539736.1 titin [Selaginella moellendorffii]